MNTKKQLRKKRALARLENQLKSGVKNTKEGVVKLSDKDTTRINKEIETLKSRV